MKNHLTTTDAADYLGLSARTLENWRQVGEKGPRFCKFGGRVLYPIAELDDYVARQIRSSTSDDGAIA